MVEVCKNRRPTAFLRAIIWDLGESGGKICKRRLQKGGWFGSGTKHEIVEEFRHFASHRKGNL